MQLHIYTMFLCNHKPKDEMFTEIEKYHQMLLKENSKAALDKSHFFLTRVKLLGCIIEKKHYHSIKIPHRRNSKTYTSFQ